MQNESINPIELRMMCEMLRFHVSHVMFCAKCECVLDVKRAVSFDLLHKPGDSATIKDADVVLSGVWCGKCFDARLGALRAIAGERALDIAISDGRVLFGRPKRAPAAALA